MRLPLIFSVLMASMAFASPVVGPHPQGFDEMGALSSDLSTRDFDFSVTRNELGECESVTVIFARGTTELGNVGSLAGPPFFNALDSVIGADHVAVQGLDYPATILGYLGGGDKEGAQTLADLTEQAASQCPDTQIILSGYSQGAQVIHLGEEKISPETAARVVAVVLFGDPKKGQPFRNIDQSKVKVFCFAKDLICEALPVVATYHLLYAVEAIPAAKFVAEKVNVR